MSKPIFPKRAACPPGRYQGDDTQKWSRRHGTLGFVMLLGKRDLGTLKRPWASVEAAVAKHFGVKPQSLWPDRYDAAGPPLSFPASKRNRAAARRQRQKSTAI